MQPGTQTAETTPGTGRGPTGARWCEAEPGKRSQRQRSRAPAPRPSGRYRRTNRSKGSRPETRPTDSQGQSTAMSASRAGRPPRPAQPSRTAMVPSGCANQTALGRPVRGSWAARRAAASPARRLTATGPICAGVAAKTSNQPAPAYQRLAIRSGAGAGAEGIGQRARAPATPGLDVRQGADTDGAGMPAAEATARHLSLKRRRSRMVAYNPRVVASWGALSDLDASPSVNDGEACAPVAAVVRPRAGAERCAAQSMPTRPRTASISLPGSYPTPSLNTVT